MGLRFFRRNRAAPLVQLYSRKGCQLCHELYLELQPWIRRGHLRVEIVDLKNHPELEKDYGAVIPVLEYKGRPFAKGRVQVPEALQRLERRIGQEPKE